MTLLRHWDLIDVQFYGGPHDGRQSAFKAPLSAALELSAGHCCTCGPTVDDDGAEPARVLYAWDGTLNPDGQRRYRLQEGQR